MLPVSDLAVSASFYIRLLELELRREFVAGGRITGCSLSRGDLPYALSLRLESSLRGGDADLCGEHPIIWRVEDEPALRRFGAHVDRLGLPSSVRRHDDGDLVCVVDRDGHAVLVGLPLRLWTRFQGYELTPSGYRLSHDDPRLRLTGGLPERRLDGRSSAGGIRRGHLGLTTI